MASYKVVTDLHDKIAYIQQRRNTEKAKRMKRKMLQEQRDIQLKVDARVVFLERVKQAEEGGSAGCTTLHHILATVPSNLDTLLQQALIDGVAEKLTCQLYQGRHRITFCWSKILSLPALEEMLQTHACWFVLLRLMNCTSQEWLVDYDSTVCDAVDQLYLRRDAVCPFDRVDGHIRMDVSEALTAKLNSLVV